MLSAPAVAGRDFSLPRLTSPQSLRIIHVVPRLRGVEAMQVLRLCERLAEYDTASTIVSVYPSELSAEERAALGSIHYVELPQAKSTYGRVRALAGELRRLKPLVAHFHLSFGRYAGRLAAMVAGGIPVVVLTLDGEEGSGTMRALGDRVLAPWTSSFVVATEAVKREVRKFGVDDKKIDIIPGGALGCVANMRVASTARAKLNVRNEDIALILPARLAAQKNQRLAMRACARLFGEREDWQLLLLGEGSDDAMLRREAGRLHIATRVQFLANLWDLQSILPAMDLFVIPSNWERLPTAMGDAMMLGVPVVSTPWDGYDEFLIDGETGFVAADWSQEAFADAIERALIDKERTRRVVKRARIFAGERFDMDQAARKHAILYRTQLRKH